MDLHPVTWWFIIAQAFVYFATLPVGTGSHQRAAAYLCASFIIFLSTQKLVGDLTPMFVSAPMDTVLAFLFYRLARAYRAGFAAWLVLIHAVMGVLHVAAYISNPSDLAYLRLNNTLFAFALLTLFIGTLRYALANTRVYSWLHFLTGPRGTFGGARYSSA